MRAAITVVVCALSLSLFGQGWVPAGARSMSMANASVTFDDVWAYHNNPAALAELEQFAAGVSYENRFLLKALQSQALAIAIPLKVGVISVGGHIYGSRNFRSMKGGLGYSMKLTEQLAAGVQANYQGIQLSEAYGSTGTMTAEAGIFARFTDEWRMGVSVFNLNRAKLSEFEDDRFSTGMRLGSSYLFSKKFQLAVELDKEVENALRIKTGVEYEAAQDFFLRGGVATEPIELSFGFGYHWGPVHLDFGTAYRQVLGWSPHCSFTFENLGK